MVDKGCSRYTLNTTVSASEPTYQREKTVQDLGSFKVKSSLFKHEFGEAFFYGSGHQSRYIDFVVNNKDSGSECILKPSQKISLTEKQIIEKLNVLPSTSKEMGLSPEESKAMVRAADILFYYVSVKVGSDDRLRIILKSDDLSLVGIALETTALGLKDLRVNISQFEGDLTTPEALPVPFFLSDSRRIYFKDQFKNQFKGALENIDNVYQGERRAQERIMETKESSKKFGGLNDN